MAPSAIETVAGEPAGPVTAAPVSDDDTEASFRPNGETALSSLIVIGVVAGGEISRRPSPEVPSACARSAITCFKPAWVVVPLMISPTVAVGGVINGTTTQAGLKQVIAERAPADGTTGL